MSAIVDQCPANMIGLCHMQHKPHSAIQLVQRIDAQSGKEKYYSSFWTKNWQAIRSYKLMAINRYLKWPANQVTNRKQLIHHTDKLCASTIPRSSGLPIPICTIVNLKKGYGGRTINATINPIREPDIEARTTFAGINHLHNKATNEIRWLFSVYKIQIKTGTRVKYI